MPPSSLDSYSLDVISRFKEAILTRQDPPSVHHARDKLAPIYNNDIPNALHPKVVEYDGETHLVLTNEAIERHNFRNKRKWSDYYQAESAATSASGKKKKRAKNKDESLASDDEVGEDVDDEEDVDEENDDDDDDDEDDDASDENPFKKLKLTELLTPLSHPSELISHPAISKTFKSNVLNKLSKELIDVIEVEQNNLNWLNKLLQVLNGEDWFYLLEEQLGLATYDHGLVQDDENGFASANTSLIQPPLGEPIDQSAPEKPSENSTETAEITAAAAPSETAEDVDNKRITRGSVSSMSQNEDSLQSKLNDNLDQSEDGEEQSDTVTDPFFALPKTLEVYEAHQARTISEENDDLTNIQEDLINYLQVGIQRQHEYIKTLTQIRNGIVKVDRYRQDLFKWGKEMHDKKSS